MNGSFCYAAVAFDSAGYIATVISAEYELTIRTARYYRKACRHPSARVITHEYLDSLLDEEERRRLCGE